MVFLTPDGHHPNTPCTVPELAQRLAVDPSALERWRDDGLPVQADGRLDPYAVTNWLSWGRLDRCPALARRWRAWLRWFTTPARSCRLDVRRAQTCFLPEARALRWLVAEPMDAPGQQILSRTWADGEPHPTGRLIERTAALQHHWQCDDVIALEPVEIATAGRAAFEALVTELAGSFTYAYRQHLPHETDDADRMSGTCLDLAVRCGTALERIGRRWRLVSGVVAHRGLANAHFWVEAEDVGDVWVPIDPTIPAVARMLGADWRGTVPLAIGRCDARRVRITHHEGIVKSDLGGIAGYLDAAGDQALYCTDWAVGECSWSVAAA